MNPTISTLIYSMAICFFGSLFLFAIRPAHSKENEKDEVDTRAMLAFIGLILLAGAVILSIFLCYHLSCYFMVIEP